MQQENPSEAEIENWLKAVGIELLCQWDVLFFLYRHPTSLVGAEYIARLLGYPAEQVVAALDVLEPLQFVARSRVSQNVRLYQFTLPTEPPRGGAFERLQVLADHRAGRLLLSKHLRRAERPSQEGLEASRRFPEEAPAIVRAAQRLLQPQNRRPTWRKAI